MFVHLRAGSLFPLTYQSLLTLELPKRRVEGRCSELPMDVQSLAPESPKASLHQHSEKEIFFFGIFSGGLQFITFDATSSVGRGRAKKSSIVDSNAQCRSGVVAESVYHSALR